MKSKKSRGVAVALAFFLGGFGVHRFYLDKPGTGILTFLLSISIIGLIPALIWIWIDIIRLLVGNMKDGEGLTV